MSTNPPDDRLSELADVFREHLTTNWTMEQLRQALAAVSEAKLRFNLAHARAVMDAFRARGSVPHIVLQAEATLATEGECWEMLQAEDRAALVQYGLMKFGSADAG